MDQEKIFASLNLLKHLPPSKNHQNAIAISSLIPDQADELMAKIDKPLELGTDPDNGNQYILSEFNRDGDSYRSFWSNKYVPPLENAIYPSQHMRELEQKANLIFREYTKLYYQGGIQSTYFWDKEDGGFACAFMMKKEVDNTKQIDKGIWDSINVIDVKMDESKKKATYKITTSVILDMSIKNDQVGEVTISGSLIKAREESYSYEKEKVLDEFHLEKIGKLVEEMETQMRQYLDQIYVSKTKETIDKIRSIDGNAGFEQIQKQKAGQIYIIQNKQQ